ncbi:amidohydrolase family protein [Streptomyces sp. M92]|uniref:amidohydrolase family protein n=1 Tax=Streptomyces sp. M92 TaxID=2944250 RepID=UPI003FA693BC
MERAVTQLGLRGALINGHTHGEHLDADRFRPVRECAEALRVPIYLHPASSYDVWHSLRGHEEPIGPPPSPSATWAKGHPATCGASTADGASSTNAASTWPSHAPRTTSAATS